jgi:hypothetical protein
MVSALYHILNCDLHERGALTAKLCLMYTAYDVMSDLQDFCIIQSHPYIEINVIWKDFIILSFLLQYILLYRPTGIRFVHGYETSQLVCVI